MQGLFGVPEDDFVGAWVGSITVGGKSIRVTEQRDPAAIGGEGLWPDAVLEIRPVLPAGGEVVWEWHAWDHLIQDFDEALPYFGSIPDQAGRIDINADHRDQPPLTAEQRAAEQKLHDEMRALGISLVAALFRRGASVHVVATAKK